MGKKKPVVVAAGTAQAGEKSKKKAHSIDNDEYSMVTESSDVCQSERQAADLETPARKKKSKKGSAAAAKAAKPHSEDSEAEDDSDSAMPIVFAGKKKPSKSSKGAILFLERM